MSRSRKAYLSILLLTGGGFGVDKVFLGGVMSGPGSSAAAEVVGVSTAARSESAPAGRPAESPASDLTHLASMLAAVPLDFDSGRRDAFSIPRAWRAPAATTEKLKPSVTSAQAAASSMKVTALMAGRGLIIGGRHHAVGEEWDGITVVSVSADEAVIRHVASGTEATVRLTGADSARRDGVKVSVRAGESDQ